MIKFEPHGGRLWDLKASFWAGFWVGRSTDTFLTHREHAFLSRQWNEAMDYVGLPDEWKSRIHGYLQGVR